MVFGGETAESYYDEGVTASMKGDTAGAVAHFQKALQLDPYHVASYQQLGKCRVRQGRLQEAVECFYRVIKARPNPLPPRLDLGFALLEGGNVVRAREVFNEILRVRPDHPRATLGLASCAFAQGEWDVAFTLATEAINSGGTGFAALYLQTRAAQFVGFHDVAIDAFDRADALLERSIEGNPDLPEAYFLRGELHFARQNFAVALEAYQAAENRMDKNAHYYSYGEHFELADVLEKRGMCLLRLGRHDDARAVGSEVQTLRPESKIAALLVKDEG